MQLCLICKKPVKQKKAKYCSQDCYGISIRGRAAWNRGIPSGPCPEHSIIMQEKYKTDPVFRNKNKLALEKAHAPEARKKQSEHMLGKIPWNKGVTKETDIRVKTPKSVFKNGHKSWNTGLTKNNNDTLARFAKEMPAKIREKWQDVEFYNKVHASWTQSPNNSELVLISLLEDVVPNTWHFTGNGSFWITTKDKEHMNPDFVHCVDKKILELCGRFWHTEEDVNTRVKQYTERGWNCLIIWEDNLWKDMDNTMQQIKEFS